MLNVIGEKDLTIIVYGSNIYNVISSDLDVCIIFDKLNVIDCESLFYLVKKFQIDNSLSIDEEIPYSNKLIYTFDEIEKVIKRNPFINEHGIYDIKPIRKGSSLLGSKEMKARLILNILTTDHCILCGNYVRVGELEKAAWDLMFQTITNYYNVTNITIDTILELLYKNPNTGVEGELYLGYKKNNPNKEQYLKKILHRLISELT